MRRLTAVLAPLAVIVIVSGCAAQHHGRIDVSRPAAETPADLDRLFGERVNAGDVEGALALYEADATLVRPDGSGLATGTAAIREELVKLVALRPQMTLNVTRVLPGGEWIAVVYDDWTLKGTDPSGKRVEFGGHASETVRRQHDGTWRFVVDDPNARSVPCPEPGRHEPHKRHRESTRAHHRKPTK